MGSVLSRSIPCAHVVALVMACGALRCTYDFNRFDPAVAAAQGGGAGQNTPVSDASSGGPAADQSSGVVDSASGEPASDAAGPEANVSEASSATLDGGCGATCISTGKTCAATCNSTSDACIADCKRDNCRTQCTMTRASCLTACAMTCQGCTRDAGCQNNAQCAAMMMQ